MALNIDPRSEGKVTCASKNDMKNLANIHQSTRKFQNPYFDGILLSKIENLWASNLQRIYVSWQWRMMQNLKRNWRDSSKVTWRIWQILARALQNIKSWHFNGLFLTKVYNFWAKKTQKSYFWWHWILMPNLKQNWLVISKMTWGIWQIFTRALKSLKIWTLMGSFYPKSKMLWA